MGMHGKSVYVLVYNQYIARQRIYEMKSLSDSNNNGYLVEKPSLNRMKYYRDFDAWTQKLDSKLRWV